MNCSNCDTIGSIHLCDADTKIYEHMLLSLLPRGAAWPRDKKSTVYKLYAEGLAGGFTLVHNNVCQSLKEVWPGNADESAARWAQIFNLSECDNSAAEILAECEEVKLVEASITSRVREFWKLTLNGAPSMEDLAASYGIKIERLQLNNDYGSASYGGELTGLCVGLPFTHRESISLPTYGQEWVSQYGETIARRGQYKRGSCGQATYSGGGKNVDIEYPETTNPMPPPVDIYRVMDVGKILRPRYGCAPYGSPYGVAQNAALFFCAASKIAPAHTITCFI